MLASCTATYREQLTRPLLPPAPAHTESTALHNAYSELKKGVGLEKRAPDLAASHYAETLMLLWPSMASARGLADDEWIAIYNAATARLAAILPKSLNLPATGLIPARTLKISGKNLQILRGFQMIPASDVTVSGLRNQYRRAGLGGTLVGFRPNTKSTPLEMHFPPEGIVRPFTAVARVGESITLELYNPVHTNSVRIANHTVPLAADFTKPWGILLSKTGTLTNSGFGGLRNPDRGVRTPRLYLMEPYDPGKRVILMVHGLKSNPLVWAQVTNELRGDPTIRENYQVWHYDYPTGYPVLYNAKVFREELSSVRQMLDPGLDDPAMHHMVVIGHSMGGLLTRTLVTDPGLSLWDSLISVPPAQLRVNHEDREFLKNLLVFRHNPAVGRAIYIAVPHRGSNLAKGWIGLIGSSLVELPSSIRGIYARAIPANPDAFRAETSFIYRHGAPNSIDTLSPSNPVLRPLADARSSVPFHTIYGHRGHPGSDSSDGVVPYTSSHLDGAESEAGFDAGHDVVIHPDAIREIQRILRFDLKSSPLP